MKSIIVVDDDRNIRQTIIDILFFEDLVGEPFSSAEGVLDRLKLGDVGLVITDLNMPGLDGIQMGPRSGIALEPQVWPDSIHHRHFPQAILRPGEQYTQHTQFAFTKVKA